jgi:hypothetical protein
LEGTVSLFVVDERQVEFLREIELAATLNQLLLAEGEKRRISPTKIHFTLRITEPDGGVDARVEAPSGLVERWIPSGTSVWQYKAGGSLDRRHIRKEFQKRGVQETVRSGGTYCLSWSKGCGDAVRKNREEWLKECFESAGLAPKFIFFDAGKIARWASEHPVVAMSRFGRRAGELMLWKEWAAQSLHQIPYQPNEQRTNIINEIRAAVERRSGAITYRLEGLAGVGKTRLAIEAFRGTPSCDTVLYASSPAAMPFEFFSWLAYSSQIEVVLVVDECEKAEADRLALQVERCGGRVVVITIGPARVRVADPARLPTGVYLLQRLGDEEIERVVRAVSPSIYPEAAKFVSRLSSGYVKFAVKLAEALVRNPEIAGAHALAGDWEISNILESMIPDAESRAGMKAISLLKRVGWDEGLAEEGKTVAEFVGMDWRRLQDVAERMFNQGVVAKQGRYRYVTPHILAVWLAATVWDSRGESMLDLLHNLSSPASKSAMLERLADLGEHERVQQVVERLLSEEGLFGEVSALDTDQASGVFSTLALASPRASLEALERLLLHLPRDRLQEFKDGRRHIVWLLEKLAWHPEWFFRAGRVILALAEAENETYANNATGGWTGLFLTGLGGTAVPAKERYILIEEALGSDSTAKRLLAVHALRSALSMHETRSGGAEDQGGRLVPAEWRPSNPEEYVAAKRAALELLDGALAHENDEIAKEARSVLLGSLRTLVNLGLAGEAITRVERLNTGSEEKRRDVRRALQDLLRFESKVLTAALQDKVKRLLESLEEVIFRERVRRWCGRLSSADMPLREKEERVLEERAGSLAQEAYDNPALLREELEWLVSSDAEHVWPFAKKLGELDLEAYWFETLVILARSGKGILFFVGYLKGRAEAGSSEWVEGLLDKWCESDENLGVVVFEYMWRAGASEDRVRKILHLVDSGKLPPGYLGRLVWGDWTKNLPAASLKDIIKRLMLDQGPGATEAALALIDRRMETRKEETQYLSEEAWELVARSCPLLKGPMIGFHWQRVAERILDQDAVGMAKLVIEFLKQTDEMFLKGDPPLAILKLATENSPNEVWDDVGKVLLEEGARAVRLRVMLERWYGECLDAEYLIGWAEKHRPRGPYIAALMASVGGVPLRPLARGLLTRFPGQDDVGNVLAGNYFSGSFSGSYSSWLEGKLTQAREWARDEHPAVRKWAAKLVGGLEKDIRAARLREEERGY